MIDRALAARTREIIAGRNAGDPFIIYQALASVLGLQPPGTIYHVAAALDGARSGSTQIT